MSANRAQLPAGYTETDLMPDATTESRGGHDTFIRPLVIQSL